MVTNSSVQHDRISSSSDMDQVEPPIKKSKVESDGGDETNSAPIVNEQGNYYSCTQQDIIQIARHRSLTIDFMILLDL